MARVQNFLTWVGHWTDIGTIEPSKTHTRSLLHVLRNLVIELGCESAYNLGIDWTIQGGINYHYSRRIGVRILRVFVPWLGIPYMGETRAAAEPRYLSVTEQ